MQLLSTEVENGTQRFTAQYNKDNVGSWVALANLTSAQFQTQFDTWTDAGLILRFHAGYDHSGVANFGSYWSSD